ncbi:MAG: hypothetical protein QXH00_07575 [Candidatus Jordarchaeales archaeon]
MVADIVAELAEQRGLAGYGFEKGIDESYFNMLPMLWKKPGKCTLSVSNLSKKSLIHNNHTFTSNFSKTKIKGTKMGMLTVTQVILPFFL